MADLARALRAMRESTQYKSLSPEAKKGADEIARRKWENIHADRGDIEITPKGVVPGPSAIPPTSGFGESLKEKLSPLLAPVQSLFGLHEPPPAVPDLPSLRPVPSPNIGRSLNEPASVEPLLPPRPDLVSLLSPTARIPQPPAAIDLTASVFPGQALPFPDPSQPIPQAPQPRDMQPTIGLPDRRPGPRIPNAPGRKLAPPPPELPSFGDIGTDKRTAAMRSEVGSGLRQIPGVGVAADTLDQLLRSGGTGVAQAISAVPSMGALGLEALSRTVFPEGRPLHQPLQDAASGLDLASRRIQEAGQDIFQPQRRSVFDIRGPGDVPPYVASVLGQTVPLMAASAGTALKLQKVMSPTVASLLSSIGFFGVQPAREVTTGREYAKTGKIVPGSPLRELAIATALGGIEQASGFTPGKLLNVIGVGKATKQQVARTAGQKLFDFFKNMLGEGGEEGAQKIVTRFHEHLNDKGVEDSVAAIYRDITSNPEFQRDLGEDIAGGLVGGAFFGAIDAAAESFLQDQIQPSPGPGPGPQTTTPPPGTQPGPGTGTRPPPGGQARPSGPQPGATQQRPRSAWQKRQEQEAEYRRRNQDKRNEQATRLYDAKIKEFKSEIKRRGLGQYEQVLKDFIARTDLDQMSRGFFEGQLKQFYIQQAADVKQQQENTARDKARAQARPQQPPPPPPRPGPVTPPTPPPVAPPPPIRPQAQAQPQAPAPPSPEQLRTFVEAEKAKAKQQGIIEALQSLGRQREMLSRQPPAEPVPPPVAPPPTAPGPSPIDLTPSVFPDTTTDIPAAPATTATPPRQGKKTRKPTDVELADRLIAAGIMEQRDRGRKQYAYTFRKIFPLDRWITIPDLAERNFRGDRRGTIGAANRAIPRWVDAGILDRLYRKDGTPVYAWKGTERTADLVDGSFFDDPANVPDMPEMGKVGTEIKTDAPAATAAPEPGKVAAGPQQQKPAVVPETPSAAVRPDQPPAAAPAVQIKPEGPIQDAPATPKSPDLPQQVQTVPTESLSVDPDRFQFKQDVNLEGVTQELKDVQKWDPELGGVILTWKDPVDGKNYVVNGHHRVELARRVGQKVVDIRPIQARNATDARTKGALANIAEGRGTPFDVAKVIRDAGLTMDALKARGISPRGKLAKEGTALAALHDGLFSQAQNGTLPLEQAIVIGESIPKHDDQWQLVKKIDDAGRPVSAETLREWIRFMNDAPRVKGTEQTLFGDEETDQSAALEKAELSAHIKSKLAKDQRLFGFVSKAGRASDLAKGGNIIDAEKSRAIAQRAGTSEDIFNRLSVMSGPIADALNDGAVALKKGGNRDETRRLTYEKVSRAIESELRGLPAPADAAKPTQTSGGERASIQPGIFGEPGPGEYPAPRVEERDGVRYELSGDRFPGTVDESGKRGRVRDRGVQLDLFANASAPPKSADIQAGQIASEFGREVSHVQTGTFDVGLDQITSPEDAARAFLPLATKAQETAMALVLDKNNRPIRMIRVSIGAINQTYIPSYVVAGAIQATPGAASAWISHNHPSGELTPSPADRDLTKELNRLMEGSGIELSGHMVVGTGQDKAMFVAKDGLPLGLKTPAKMKAKVAVPLTEREITTNKPLGNRLTFLDDVKDFIAKSVKTKNAVILVDNQIVPVAVVPMGSSEMGLLRTGKPGTGASKLLRAIEKSNAIGMFIVAEKGAEAEAANLAEFASNEAGMKAHDIIIDGSSYYATGKTISTGGPFKAKTEKPEKPIDRADLGRIVADARTELKGGPEFVIVARPTDLPGKDHADDIAGMYWKGKAYLVAENIRDADHAKKIIAHEGIEHYGVMKFEREIFGPGGANKFYQEVADMAKTDDRIAQIRQQVEKEYPGESEHVLRRETSAKVAEELARNPETFGEKVRAFFQRILGKAQDILRRLGLKIQFNMNDLARTFQRIREKMREAPTKEDLAKVMKGQQRRRVEKPVVFGADPFDKIGAPGPKGFFSPARKVVSEKMPPRAPVSQVLKILESGKSEEVADLGLKEWLATAEGLVSKSDVLAFIDAGGPNIQEKVRSGPGKNQWEVSYQIRAGEPASDIFESQERAIDFADRIRREGFSAEINLIGDKESSALHEGFQLPGGTNYREIIFTVPDVVGDHYGPEAHFPERNILFHLRVNDREGPEGEKILFAEEVQSDLHKKGQKRGYVGSGEVVPIRNDADTMTVYQIKWPNGDISGPYRTKETAILDSSAGNAPGVPDAPLKKSWPTFALKRLIQMAADEGYDAVGWTTGQQQIDRYDLRQPVSEIAYWKDEDGTWGVSALDLGGSPVTGFNPKEGMTDNDLNGSLGRELARKITQDEGDNNIFSDESGFLVNGQLPRGVKVIQGNDLYVGGYGMTAFYDDRMVADAKKFVKGLSKVEQAEVSMARDTEFDPEIREIERSDGDRKFEIFDKKTDRPIDWFSDRASAEKFVDEIKGNRMDTIHLIRITPELKERVEQGIPLYSKKPQEKPEPNILEKLADEMKIGPGKGVGRRGVRGSINLENVVEKIIGATQDLMRPLENVQTDIGKKTGVKILEEQDALLKDRLRPGRQTVRIERADEELFKPFVNAIMDSGFTIQEFEDVRYALHAPERNAHIGSINPKFQTGLFQTQPSGSGMTDAEAQTILKDFLKKHGRAGMRKMWALNQAYDHITNMNLQMAVDYGLITQKAKNELQRRWAYYAPLKGRPDADTNRTPIGQGLNVQGKEFKTATGRVSKAQFPILAATQEQLNATIIRGEKNRVDQAFLKFVQAHPDPKLWEVNKIEMRPWLNPRTGLVEDIEDRQAKYRDDVLSLKVNGQEYHITIKNPDLASAMKNLDAQLGGQVVRTILGAGQIFNRFQSIANTGWNPEFAVVNPIRDIQTALTKIGVDLGSNTAKRIISNYPSALRTAFNMVVRGDRSGAGGQLFDEWELAGGKTGWYNQNDVDTTAANLQQVFDDLKGGAGANLRAARDKFLNFMSTASEVGEVTTRFAIYKAAKEAGFSIERSAQASRAGTIDFNVGGSLKRVIHAGWVFGNARIQGIRMVGDMAKDAVVEKTPRGKRARKAIGAMIAFGFFMDSMARLMTLKDDDDERTAYDKIQDWEKDQNFVLMNPRAKKGDVPYIKVPMLQGFNFFPAIGRHISSMMWKAESPGQAASALFSTVSDLVNPVGGPREKLAPGLLPTAMKPFVQSAYNENYLGQEIVPSQPSWETPKPKAYRHWKSASPYLVDLTQWLNEKTGGDDIEKGWVDVSPETFRHYLGFATGEAGRTAMRTANVIEKLRREEEIQPREIPFARRFVGQEDERETPNRFYQNLQEIDKTNKRLEQAEATTGTKARANTRKLRRDKEAELSLKDIADKLRPALSGARDAIDLLKKDPKPQAKKELKEIGDNMTTAQKIFNAEFDRAQQNRESNKKRRKLYDLIQELKSVAPRKRGRRGSLIDAINGL